jgi:hypothetical protein
MKRPFQTMLRLTKSQKNLAAEKLADLANLAAAGLVFGQLLAGTSPGWTSILIGTVGIGVWVVLILLALGLNREANR